MLATTSVCTCMNVMLPSTSMWHVKHFEEFIYEIPKEENHQKSQSHIHRQPDTIALIKCMGTWTWN